jgi:hypothetical protein
MSSEQMDKLIQSMRGSLKSNLGNKPFAEWLSDLNREEKELEERKYRRLAAMGKVGK